MKIQQRKKMLGKRTPGKRMREGFLMALICAVFLLAGCGAKDPAVATLNGEKIGLSEAVFYTRLNQQQWEQAYAEHFGRDFWSKTLSEEAGTFEDELKRQVMDTLCQIHLMNAHAEEYQVELTKEEKAEVDTRVADFLENHSEEVKEAAGAKENLVKELLTERTLADKVAQALVADYEPEITEEEASLGKMTYCLFSTLGTYDTEGNHYEVTEEEAKQIENEAEAFARRAAELGDLTAAAEEISHTCIDVYFNDTNNGGAHQLVADQVRTMEPGQTAGPIKTEEGYYVIQYISQLDERATEDNREKLIQAGKEERCRKIYEEWLSQAEFAVDEEVWNTVKVDQVLFVQ